MEDVTMLFLARLLHATGALGVIAFGGAALWFLLETPENGPRKPEEFRRDVVRAAWCLLLLAFCWSVSSVAWTWGR